MGLYHAISIISIIDLSPWLVKSTLCGFSIAVACEWEAPSQSPTGRAPHQIAP